MNHSLRFLALHGTLPTVQAQSYFLAVTLVTLSLLFLKLLSPSNRCLAIWIVVYFVLRSWALLSPLKVSQKLKEDRMYTERDV